MIIAIDGPAAAGKGTLAQKLADHYGLSYLDTGALYRAVGCALLEAGLDPHDKKAAAEAAQNLDLSRIEKSNLRTAEAGEAASVVSVNPQVREALLQFQRDFAATAPGAVLDGRDIGTVVAPDADIKLFVTASADERAHRRWLELKGRGENVDEAQIRRDIEKRDARDSARASAPLKMAEDAHLLDTTKLDIEAAFHMAVSLIDDALDGGVSA